VFAIGTAMRQLRLRGQHKAVGDAILDRATEAIPRKRYRSLKTLRKAWRSSGAGDVIRSGEELVIWRHIEEGFGWLALDQPQRALAVFERAINHARSINHNSSTALIGRAHARAAIERAGARASPPFAALSFSAGAVPPMPRQRDDVSPPQAFPKYRWLEICDVAAAHEQKRAFREALELYAATILDKRNDAAIFTAIARCQLALGATGIAIDFAQRAIEFESGYVEPHGLLARAWHAHGDAAKSLAAADAWTALRPADAGAHYARGRALMMLARYHDARAAFDRAHSLDPKMLEAIMMQREADRSIARVRDEVGSQPEIKLDLPLQLAHLADLLAAGRIADVLQILESPKHVADPESNLVRARCLAFAKRFDDAISAFDRVIEQSPDRANVATLGKAYALLDANRAADALRLFDTMTFDAAALEGRALALHALGRIDEAEATMREVTNTRA